MGCSQLDELTENERSQIIRRLQTGSEMMVYHQKAERLTVKIIIETKQVAVFCSSDKISTALNIAEIKEIRQWETSEDFPRFIEKRKFRRMFNQSVPQDCKTCFTIFYGTEFILNSLSFNADTVEDAENWLIGLELLRQETLAANTTEIIESWLWKQMYSFNQTKKNSISKKDLKCLLRKMNFTVSSGHLEEVLEMVGANENDLNFEQFHKTYNHFIFENQKSILEEFEKGPAAFKLRNTDAPNSSTVGLYDFQKFILYPQREAWAKDLDQVKDLMSIFMENSRKTNNPKLTVGEFLSFLFSKENSIWDEKFSEINPLEMNNPLSHYWINSSHNTYLTGDQISSESSTEAYVRCLRLGCRCIELDCWDGPEEPVIYHGRTMTSKIKLKDVVKAINDHAFATSDYPVVLSIEEHCNPKQQKVMAQMFRDVFQDKLLTEPLEPNANQLPSPNQLKGKIIIKHRKIQESDCTIKQSPVKKVITSFKKMRNDYRDKVPNAKERVVMEKEGELCIWDPIDERFYRHDCVLSDNKLYYSEEKQHEDNPEVKDGSDLHISEPWFHGRLAGGRHTAELLLHDFCERRNRIDGTFLVRESDTFVRNYSISIWSKSRIRHYRIFYFLEDGHSSFFLTIKEIFPSLCALIRYYRRNPIEYDELNLCLVSFLPRPDSLPPPKAGWFYSSLSRGKAEDYLKTIPRDGVFLVRKRKEPDTFALSVRIKDDVKHFQIHRKNKYELGSFRFDSLEEMISNLQEIPLNFKLRYPVTPELVERFQKEDLSTWDSETYKEIADGNPLEERCQGVVDIFKCNIECITRHGTPKVVTLINKETLKRIKFTTKSLEEVDEWYQVILNIIQRHQNREKMRIEEMESNANIALEMSDMVVYCQSVKKKSFEKYSYKEVRSFPNTMIPEDRNETADDKLCILKYHCTALTRVFPSADRIDSSNFDPCPSWKLGCQMVALNFQSDTYTFLNHALFTLNGGAGYVLKPEWMRDPTKKKTTKQNITIKVIAARHLPTGMPFVNVELWPYVNSRSHQIDDYSFKTSLGKVEQTNVNPVWLGPKNPPRCFKVDEPDLAFLRFEILKESTFSEGVPLAQATFPVRGIRSGYRSVPLKSSFSENLELASLLVHVDVKQVED
ncbi:1-phosphatidylinositol 4,5-bisphosphate phosphodiesterase gamma-2 [Paramisgurnus dabryanus]|uniref:1-phosphatidylinositol 4,5-bisphosphate phosphodiesterase gamma-2 n=1 Tax=Paramisgurnus dabryanus TaxID=90735 RepID=UPI003CCF54F1